MAKNIKILIACHKPTELPNNPLYLPVHVGAAKSKRILDGMQRDDDGADNISIKNDSYCEMTAQYWAWKNLDADYYGLCHYRRYFCFSDEEFPNTNHDGRNQTICRILTPETEHKYGLLDEDYTREVIENNDVIVCRKQDLSDVWTPDGPQKSIYNHYKAHDHVIVNIADIDSLINTVRNMYPELGKSFSDYLNGKLFYGYNMFVLRRDLFFQLCEFEFSVLSEMENQIDFSHYSNQLKRVFGYLGELLQSFWLDRLIRTNSNIKYRELQLVFFEKTDKISRVEPTDAIPVIVDLFDEPQFLFSITLQSLIHHMNHDQKYELIFVTDRFSQYNKNIIANYIERYQNIKIRFVDFADFRDKYYELGIDSTISFKPLIPFLFENYDRVIALSWNTIINDDLQKLYRASSDKPIYAATSILQQARMNDHFDSERKRLGKYFSTEDSYNYFDTNVLVMNLKKCRDVITSVETVFGLMKKGIEEDIILNLMYKGEVGILDFKYNYYIPANSASKQFLCNAPADCYNTYVSKSVEPAIKQLEKEAIWDGGDSEAFFEVWNLMKDTVFFPHFVDHQVFRFYLFSKDDQIKGIKDILFPRNSKRRRFINDIRRLFRNN